MSADEERPRKRGNGTGSVYPEGDRWIACVTIGSGRKRRIAHSKSAAQALLRQMIRERDGTGLAAGSRTTVNEYMLDWLATEKKPRLRPHSYASTCARADHVMRSLGTKRLDSLTPHHIRSFYRDLLTQPAGKRQTRLKPRTVSQIHFFLREALEAAVQAGKIGNNPCQHIRPPTWEDPEWNLLSPPDLLRVLRAFEDHRLSALFVFLATTAVRIGEATALHWDDVSLDAGTARIKGTLTKIPGGGLVVGPPKSKSSIRTILIGRLAVLALREHRTRQLEERLATPDWEDQDFVFPGSKGQPILTSTVDRIWTRTLKQLGIENVRIHDLRHGAATTLLDKRIPVKAVSKRLGHSDVRVTLSVYAHVLESMEDEAAEVMDDVLAEASAP